MNIKDIHRINKPLDMFPLFSAEEGNVFAIQLLKDAILPEHATPIPALLICIEGKVEYKDESNSKETLLAGDFLQITPNVKHFLEAKKDSQLILIK